ncbi:MAG TPA: Ni/Fe-hydrogenase cytochrome b subunit [Bryobacteraceae bacterium]|nr:Ni/Fe-hydrogenase cytochrome b subunit [Bryobacteraceae bacterium]
MTLGTGTPAAKRWPRITVWRAIFAAILLSGAYATYLRIFYGLGGSTNLSDKFPWGLWIAFDVMCGVALAAGGFTLVAIVHIFGIEKYRPVLRPCILTAFLGYVLVVVGLLFDLGRPDRLWHPLVMWNPHSVMFEVAWCVTLYSTVLFLEFVPVVCERFGWAKPAEWIHRISVPLMILGILLSTLHQSSLGSLFLIVPAKLYPLWYSPVLPLLFFVSAIAVGLAMTIFESWHSSRAFGRALELPLLASLGRVLAVTMSVYLWIRFLDLLQRGVLPLVARNRMETWLFALEIGLALVPTVLLYQRSVRMRPGALYACAVMVVFSVIANRLNVGTTGLEAGSGTHYTPKWSEIAITLSIVAAGFAIFRMVAGYFPIFEAQAHGNEHAVAEVSPQKKEVDPVAVG